MGSASASDIETTIPVQSSPSGQTTFEAFVKNAIQKIQREAWGRSNEVVEIRNACQTFLDFLSSEESGGSMGVHFKDKGTRAALKPLKLACNSTIPRIVEPALGCLHKLVAYAWVQGESSDTGNMSDDTIVSEIVGMVVKCIQVGNASVYLAVIRALLTFATAEHFVAHGHCLLHMVRTVFNLAVSTEDTNLKRTACNALLQMLNTIVKRVIVTQFQLTSHQSLSGTGLQECLDQKSPTKSEDHEEEEDPDNPDPSVEEEKETEPSSTWKLADLAEKEDIEALEAAFEDKQRGMEETVTPRTVQTDEGTSNAKSTVEESPTDPTTSQNQGSSPKKSKRPRGWDQLTVLEKDVLVVLMAFCKLAGVNTTLTASDAYVRHGKLLALELLVKVFENSGHRWENVRLEFCEQLRFPLCLVLIRNCNPSETKSFQFAIRLFVSVMMQRQIRLGLKPELGALYPLLLLRPLETGNLEPSVLTVTLTAIKKISKEPQMQVDMFINYDCNLKAPNLYERTAKALSQLAVYGDPAASLSQSSILRDAAGACAMAMLASLDAWAGPVRDAANVGHASNEEFNHGVESTSMGNGTSSVIGNSSEVKHFGAAKEKKNSFSIGVELFNKSPAKGIASLVASGVLNNKPDAIASFLRKHKEQLDDTMVGEYLGLHDEIPLKVMYAFIDMEQFADITIDVALRNLLNQFRLPGEAQKIDRIMEKFAERYCQDNVDVFHSADDAYVLAFSLIMLNTDQHNPMAEKRLTKQDFISMNQRQEPDGSFVEVLPIPDLEAMFDRIASQEIKTVNTKIGIIKQEDALALHRNLASAVGLTQLALPFRSGKVWDKMRGAQIEHEHLLAITQKVMRSDAVDADLWFTATHTEHSRPMLEVAGPCFLKALTASLESAAEKDAAEKSVSSVVMAIHLAALLGLDTLCQQFVSALCKAIGVHSKEALIRTNPARQICALRALIGVASDDQAGLLGSSWTLILRTISCVEALISDMRRSHKSNQSVFEESMQALKFQSFDKKDHDRSSAIGRFFTNFSLGKADVEMYSSISPGQAIRLWSDGEGITEMDRIFIKSPSLDGEAVVNFCKALCLVSQEELTPGISHLEAISPRVFSLRKLVECAYYNLGRIRLIWGRLWTAIASHLVNASCHSDQTVAMYSVDSLRQLVGKLLSRDELANFTTQSDTLRPFVLVLKQCANVVVRELAVQCIEQAMNTHSSRLGSGWVVILEFLSVASLDPAPSVTRQCLETLQSVIDVHWRKWGRGRDAIADCVNVALRVARNPHNLDCSLRAIQLIKSSADELVAELKTQQLNQTTRSISVDYSHEENEGEIHRTSSVPSSSPPSSLPKKEIFNQVEPLLSRSSLWTIIFESLVEVITREERGRCADLAAEILFSFAKDNYLATWDRSTWSSFFRVALVKVFDHRENAYSMETGLDRILSYSTSFFPDLWAAISSNYDKNGKLLLAHLLDILVGWLASPRQPIALSGVYLLQDLVNGVAQTLDEEGWGVVVENLKFAWKVCVSGSTANSKPSPESENQDLPEKPFKMWIQNVNQEKNLEMIQTRCQILISLQRVLHQIHRTHGNLLSSKMLKELTEMLLKAVQQITEANKDSEFLNTLLHIIQGTKQPIERSPRKLMMSESSEIQAEEEPASLMGLPSLRVDVGPSTPTQQSESPTLEVPDLVHSLKPRKSDSCFCGLLKLQVEGGMLTIQALERQGEIENLCEFCRALITEASLEIRTEVERGRVQEFESQWEHSMKAPLISQALDVYKSMEGKVVEEELKRLAPHLATLICSRELEIRQSVANLLKTKTVAMLDTTC